MLEFLQFKKIIQIEREKIVAEKLIVEIPPVIKKYKFDDLNLQKFKKDAKNWKKN